MTTETETQPVDSTTTGPLDASNTACLTHGIPRDCDPGDETCLTCHARALARELYPERRSA